MVDGRAIDTDAFGKVEKVRRGEQSHLHASLLQDRCYGVGARALAVGSCHVDGLVFLMWFAKDSIHLEHTFQPWLVGVGTNVFEDGQLTVQKVQSFLICHISLFIFVLQRYNFFIDRVSKTVIKSKIDPLKCEFRHLLLSV